MPPLALEIAGLKGSLHDVRKARKKGKTRKKAREKD